MTNQSPLVNVGYYPPNGPSIVDLENNMPKYAETSKLLERDDIQNVSIEAAVKNIEQWQEDVSELASSGSKSLKNDLEHLRSSLAEENPDGDRIAKIMGRLGDRTIKLADEAPSTTADKLRHIGEALASYDSDGDNKNKS